MNNWEKFKSKEEKPADLPFEDVFGMFYCQVCDDYAEEAQYFYTDKVLKWKCPNDHVNFAEDFDLG